MAVWSAREFTALQARMDSLASALQAYDDRGATAGSTGNVEERLKKLDASAPGLGEIMSGIQIHAAKLYFAGHAGNWPLVEFEMGEIDEAMAAVPVVRPQENNVPLAPVMSFWVASPTMDPEMFALTVATLGWPLAVVRLGATLLAVILTR